MRGCSLQAGEVLTSVAYHHPLPGPHDLFKESSALKKCSRIPELFPSRFIMNFVFGQCELQRPHYSQPFSKYLLRSYNSHTLLGIEIKKATTKNLRHH